MSTIWTITPHAIAALPVPGWECVFGLNDCTLRDITFWVWILRAGDKVALIDTGLPSGQDMEDLDRANQALDEGCVFWIHQTLADVLAAENLTGADIDYVLISQLVTYSTGGLSRETFPNATVYCAWEGMVELLTQSPGHPPKPFYFTPATWNALREFLVDHRLVFAQAAVEVAPGLIYEPTGGHHPGSAGIRAATEKGWVGILETAFVQENIERGVPIGIAENAAECREVIRRYRKECALTLAGHEPTARELLAKFLSRE